MNAYDSYRHIQLVTTEDPEYVAFMRRMQDRNPSRGGPRSAGEYLGGLVEQCVRHWLSGFVPLKPERILRWEQRLNTGRHGTLYREIDAIWQIDAESLCLYEMKLTFPENMEKGTGLRQLDASTNTLFVDRQWQYILKRLVYVAEEPIPVLEGDVPPVEPDDENTAEGVVWVPPSAVVQAAQELALELPENWLEPESREGYIEDPEREEWRQYVEDEPESDVSNPLADALRRVLKTEE